MQTIYDLTLKQMQEMLEAHGQKAYRAKQIFLGYIGKEYPHLMK